SVSHVGAVVRPGGPGHSECPGPSACVRGRWAWQAGGAPDGTRWVAARSPAPRSSPVASDAARATPRRTRGDVVPGRPAGTTPPMTGCELTDNDASTTATPWAA